MIDSKLKNFFSCIMIIVSIIGLFITFCYRNTQICALLPLLPLSYGFFLLVYICLNRRKNLYLGSFIIIITYFIRMVITPILIAMGEYLQYKDATLDYDMAVLLMIYEECIVFIILAFVKNKKYDTEENLCTERQMEDIHFTKSVKLLVCALIVICTIFTVRYPQILKSFKFGYLTSKELVKWKIQYNNALNSMPKLIFYMISWIMKVLKEVIIFMMLVKIKNKKRNRNKMFLSLIVIGIGMLISDETLAQNLYFALLYFMLLLEFYPNKKKKLILFLVAFASLFIFYGLVFERVNEGDFHNKIYKLADTFQVYFAGIYNVAVSLKIKIANPLIIIEGDFLRSIPLLKSFFINKATSTQVFNECINDKYESQIIPALGQSVMFLGRFFAPLIAGSVTALTVKYEKRLPNEKNYFDKFICYVIIIKLACVPVVYNAQLFMQGLFNIIIPLLLISFFNKRRIKK